MVNVLHASEALESHLFGWVAGVRDAVAWSHGFAGAGRPATDANSHTIANSNFFCNAYPDTYSVYDTDTVAYAGAAATSNGPASPSHSNSASRS